MEDIEKSLGAPTQLKVGVIAYGLMVVFIGGIVYMFLPAIRAVLALF